MTLIDDMRMLGVDDSKAAWMRPVFSSYNVVDDFQLLHTVSMSQVASRLDLESGNGSGNAQSDRPRVSFQTPQGGLHFRDSSGQLFSMYSKFAEAEDNKMAERWQKDADGILIFAGLFSAVVATLLSVTISDLTPPQPQPQGISEFYLKNICQSLSHQNQSCDPPPSLITDSSTFSPSKSAIWVNSLWFLSVSISLTCAMLATFMQKWARRYIRVTQPSRYSPHKRARLRAFFSEGVDKWHVSWAVEALPTLLHISLFLFFVGLVIYLFNTNHFVFYMVVWWVVLSKLAYLSITFLPIFRPNSPYIAPLSSPIWYLYGSIRYAVFKVISFPTIGYAHLDPAHRFRRLEDRHYNQFFQDIGKIAEKVAWKQASEIDVRILQSAFDALDEAGGQEEFFGAIPGFFESKEVNLLEEHLTDEFRDKLRLALYRFLDRTLSLSSVSESVRGRRLVICLDAARAALGSDGVSQILWDILSGRWPELIQSVEMVQSLRHWNNKNDKRFTRYVQRIVAQVVVDVRERDDRWISLVRDEFAVPDRELRSYISHGDDSVLLSILIHVTRHALDAGSWTPWVLSSLSGFSIHDTLPGLQHSFCALWNDILFEARDQGEDSTYVKILRDIRHAYINLHRSTDAVPTFPAHTYYFDPVLVQPWSYRHCNIAGHRQDLTVRTPVTSSFNIPPSPTQLSASPNALPQPSPSRRYRIPPHIDTQTSTRRSPAANLAPSPTQAPSISSSSVSESTRVTIPRELDRLIPGKASNDSRQSAPSAAKIAATNSIRSDDLSPQNHTNDSGETSHTPAAPFLTFQHPCPVPATVTPFTRPDVGDNPDALQDATSSTTLSHPLEGNRQDTIVPCSEADIGEGPSAVNSIPGPIPIIIVSGPSSPPIVLSTLFSDTTTAEPPSSSESVSIQLDHTSHALPSPSSSPTIASSHDTDDLNSAIPMTVLHSEQTVLPAHDIVATTLQPED